jgi:DNA polymerase elongation subunit (family B)
MSLQFYTNVQLIGNKFLVRGYDNGQRIMFKEEYLPTLFIPSNTETEYKTLDGNYVKLIQPGSVKDCKEFYSKYDDIENFKIYGNERFLYQYISDKYPEEEVKFDIGKIKLITIDIEVASENGFPDVESCVEEILLITIQDYTTKNIITWGSKPFKNTQSNVIYNECSSEHHLLTSFLGWWIQNCPDIVTGWNCNLYDIPYICGRLYKVLGERQLKQLSPWGMVREKETYDNGRKLLTYTISGISQLDYLELYKKFTYKAQESYRLDYIAEVELGQKKLDHSEFETFKDFYTKDWQKFTLYNIVDVELVDRLEEKMKLIELALTMAYDAKVNYEDVFFQVRMWDSIIYNYLKKQNIVVPPKEQSSKGEYAGAYVKEPIPGVYDWIVSLDLTSLYPSLIMQYNISPETLLDEKQPNVSVDNILKKQVDLENLGNTCVAANGCLYDKTKRGIFPELVEKIFTDRQVYKKRMLKAKQEYEKTPTKDLEREISKCNNIQMARKIQINSLYGAIGNNWFRYYKLENAEAITLSGQVAIRWIENKLNQYMNMVLKTKEVDFVIASDTDSIYLNMGALVQKVFEGKDKTTEKVVNFLDTITKTQLEPFINSSYQELADYMNAYDQKMHMKRENIADRGIWTAKKRYIMNVWDSEGVRYSEPKLKMMGIEAIKSSTPAPCRKMIKDCLKIMMNGTEKDVVNYVEKCRDEFKNLSIEEIAFPRSVSNIRKFYSSSMIYEKGTPIHARGALLYNHYLKKMKVDHKYSSIKNGEKIKYCYLKIPNIIGENVISFIQYLPKEFQLDKYIDHDLQFEKAFLQPLKTILNAINWNFEKTASLESFFE